MSKDKVLYERNQIEGWQKATEWCREYAPEFLEARSKYEFEDAFECICKKAEISFKEERFVYFIDTKFRYPMTVSNLTPNYEQILRNGFGDLYLSEEDIFGKRSNQVLQSIEYLLNRIVIRLQEERPLNHEQKVQWFLRMKNREPETFEEALQRILFLNQLLWQTGCRLVGLGRLDVMLYSWYEQDVQSGLLTREQAETILKDFLKILHQYYWFKSHTLLGDTGQIIVLGGSDAQGNYIYNDLTLLFIDAVKDLQMSEPKLLLRVNKNTPNEVWQLAMSCMVTGVGSPVISNDDVIIPKLESFGIESEDARSYAVSACWEPLIAGKSSSRNNENSLCYIEALYQLLMEENLKKIESFSEFKERFFFYLKREIQYVKKALYSKPYYRNTLYSIFMEGCSRNRKDIIEGGAKYHNIGMTTVSLGNVINALHNIEKYVFEEHRYSLVDVKKMCAFDFEGYPEASEILKINHKQYGRDHDEVIALTNEILYFVTEHTKDFITPAGGKLKFGVSSPRYLMDGGTAKASFDGRRYGEAYQVHISNENVDSYTEIIRFAASLDYGENRFNGNVVDFMVSPSFIQKNQDKLIDVLKQGMKAGCFQLQMNVLSSQTLIEAKNNPEKFPNLIVRVWGFSAYFTDLPEDYQNLLIERALNNERR